MGESSASYPKVNKHCGGNKPKKLSSFPLEFKMVREFALIIKI